MRPGELGEGKIQGWQRDRLAIVYVRQSSRQQVLDHGESTRLQYGLTGRAVALGWPASRVMVIDEDLGRSAANAAERPGFAALSVLTGTVPSRPAPSRPHHPPRGEGVHF